MCYGNHADKDMSASIRFKDTGAKLPKVRDASERQEGNALSLRAAS